jgi:hypothetical protein
MSISDELQKLTELYRSGTLSREEFETAKRRVLESDHSAADQDQLQAIMLQNQIAQLDRQWEIERQDYSVRGKYGHTYIPGKTSSIVGGIAIVGFGIFWTIIAASMSSRFDGPISIFPIFGVIFILFGIAMSIYSFNKAEKYQSARKRYLQRRGQLLKSQDENFP